MKTVQRGGRRAAWLVATAPGLTSISKSSRLVFTASSKASYKWGFKTALDFSIRAMSGRTIGPFEPETGSRCARAQRKRRCCAIRTCVRRGLGGILTCGQLGMTRAGPDGCASLDFAKKKSIAALLSISLITCAARFISSVNENAYCERDKAIDSENRLSLFRSTAPYAKPQQHRLELDVCPLKPVDTDKTHL